MLVPPAIASALVYELIRLPSRHLGHARRGAAGVGGEAGGGAEGKGAAAQGGTGGAGTGMDVCVIWEMGGVAYTSHSIHARSMISLSSYISPPPPTINDHTTDRPLHSPRSLPFPIDPLKDAAVTLESELKTLKRALEDAESRTEQLAELAQVLMHAYMTCNAPHSPPHTRTSCHDACLPVHRTHPRTRTRTYTHKHTPNDT